MIKIRLKITKAQQSMPIDKAILAMHDKLSRKKIRHLLDTGAIAVNGRKEMFASYKVRVNDEIIFHYDEAQWQSKSTYHLSLERKDLLYEDSDLLAINKPPLMASVPVKSDKVPVVEACLQDLFKSKNSFMVCHRLDKETSGILLVAKQPAQAQLIMQQFKNRTIKKTYYALCYGIPEQKHWEVKAFLSSIDSKTGKVTVVLSGGYSSFTSFKLIASNAQHQLSLIACYPETGRSHQIRVHLESCGLPIVGDKKYETPTSRSRFQRLPQELQSLCLKHHFLHAYALEFENKPGQKQELHADFPENFINICQKLGLSLP